MSFVARVKLYKIIIIKLKYLFNCVFLCQNATTAAAVAFFLKRIYYVVLDRTVIQSQLSKFSPENDE